MEGDGDGDEDKDDIGEEIIGFAVVMGVCLIILGVAVGIVACPVRGRLPSVTVVSNGVGVTLGSTDAIGATEGDALTELTVSISTFLLKVSFTSLVLKVIGSSKWSAVIVTLASWLPSETSSGCISRIKLTANPSDI